MAAGGTLVLNGGLYQVESIDLAASATIVFHAATELRVKTELVSKAKARLILDPSVPGLRASQVVIYVAGRDEDCHRLEADDDGDDAGPVTVHIGAQNVVQANIYAARGTVWLKSKTTGDRGVHRRARAHRRERRADARQRVQVGEDQRYARAAAMRLDASGSSRSLSQAKLKRA